MGNEFAVWILLAASFVFYQYIFVDHEKRHQDIIFPSTLGVQKG